MPTIPDHIWSDPHSDGYIDAWNGWYPTIEHALEDAGPGCPAEIEGAPWVLARGEGLIGDDEADNRRNTV